MKRPLLSVRFSLRFLRTFLAFIAFGAYILSCVRCARCVEWKPRLNRVRRAEGGRGQTHGDELGESLPVLGGTAASGRVLEVQVQSVEPVLAQERDARLDKLGPTRNIVQHRRHLGHSEVPAADGQQSLYTRLTLFDVVEPGIPKPWSIKTCHFYFLNSFVKCWPILIIFGLRHHEKTWRK